MGNMARAFGNGKAFIGFVTGGDPSIEMTKKFALEMARAGADLIEIGVPFSDPVAEGPVIQAANERALRSGATLEKLFAMAQDLRKETAVPLAFLTYLNPVFRRGYEAFFRRAAGSGIDGVIIPDLPLEERGPVQAAAAGCGVDLVSLVAPTSRRDSAKDPDARVREIARGAAGFVYVVSSMGVTGERGEIASGRLAAIVSAIRQATDAPAAIGFGIHSPAQAAGMAAIADGVIVGSAIVRIIAERGEGAGPEIYRYVRGMKEAIGAV